jgi:hypothetical protein
MGCRARVPRTVNTSKQMEKQTMNGKRLPDYQGNDKKMPRKAEGLGTEPVVMSRVWRSWPRSIHGSLAEASVRRGVLVVLEALGSEPAATEGGLDGCRGPDGNMEIDGLVT